MEFTVSGEMSIAKIKQALFEQINQAEDECAIRYSRGATLFINPTNGFGDDVVPRNKNGRVVKKLHCQGPYRCAADEYKP